MKTLFILLAVFSLLAAIVLPMVDAWRRTNRKSDEHYGKHWKWLVPTGILAIVVACSLFIVPAQTCGVVITPSGVVQKSYPTGWYLIAPWNRTAKMDKTVQVYTAAKRTAVTAENPYDENKASATQSGTIWSPTSEGIQMGFDISASWAIDPEFAWWIYDNVSEQDDAVKARFRWLEENVIKAKLKSSLNMIVSRYKPTEVFASKKQEIQDAVTEMMRSALATYHLNLNQIDIREVSYPPDYATAVNQIQLAERKAQELVEVTKQREEERKQAEIAKDIAILKAEGEARALQIKGQAVIANPKIVELEWIDKWDGKLPTYQMGNGQGVMLNLGK